MGETPDEPTEVEKAPVEHVKEPEPTTAEETTDAEDKKAPEDPAVA